MSKILSVVVGLAIVIIVMPLIMNLFDIPSVGLSDSTFEFLQEGIIKLLYNVNFWIPLSFILTCLLLVLVTRYFGLIWGMINYIIRKVTGQ